MQWLTFNLAWFAHDWTTIFFAATLVIAALAWVCLRSTRRTQDDISNFEFDRHSVLALAAAAGTGLLGYALIVLSVFLGFATLALFITGIFCGH